jgi:hypothetical protein
VFLDQLVVLASFNLLEQVLIHLLSLITCLCYDRFTVVVESDRYIAKSTAANAASGNPQPIQSLGVVAANRNRAKLSQPTTNVHR